jgi:hypothetical protein
MSENVYLVPQVEINTSLHLNHTISAFSTSKVKQIIFQELWALATYYELKCSL